MSKGLKWTLISILILIFLFVLLFAYVVLTGIPQKEA
jgi:hypothetical protein